MTALAGPLHLLALVLVVSGLGKLVAPGPPARAMLDAGLPVPMRTRGPVRTPHPAAGVALGVVEASVGLVALAVPTWWAAAGLGTFYAALAAFVLRLRAVDPDVGCGCFGASSTPPGVAHVAVNVLAAATAFAIAAAGVPDVVDVVDEGVGVAVPYLLLLAVGAGLVLLAPALSAELGQLRSGARPRSFGSTVISSPRISSPGTSPRTTRQTAGPSSTGTTR